ncbi:hypothetical protein ES707_14481 [subsurface metagenome]
MSKGHNVSDLISLALLQLHPKSEESRNALWRSLVETALYYKDTPLSKEDINVSIGELLEQPGMGFLKDVDKSTQGCLERGTINKNDDMFTLSDAGRTRFEEIIDNHKADENNFDEGLVACVERELESPLGDKLILCSLVKYTLEEMFRARSVEIERHLLKGSYNLEDLAKLGESYDPVEMIKEKIKAVTILIGENTEEEVLRGIRQHFRELTDSSIRYINGLYLKVFYHQILNLDPKLHQYERNHFSKIRLYLDTNVLINYIFEADSLHDTAVDMIDSSKGMGCQLMISPATLKEMQYQIDKASRLFSSFGSDSRIRKLLTETSEGRRSNPILVTFFQKVKDNPDLQWDNFIVEFKHLEDYLLQRLILVEEESYDLVRDEEHYQNVWQTIRDIRYPLYADEVVYHDTDNFVLIHMLRQKYEPDPMGHVVWLLTLDSNLRIAEQRLTHYYPTPHCKTVDEWGKTLIPFQNINDFIYSDYVLYLVRSRLGITLDTTALDLDFLEPLHKPDFDIDALLDLDDPQYVARTLSRLQVNRDVRELAERARSADTPEKISEINRQLSTPILETMVSDKKVSDEKAEELTRKIKDLRRRLAEIDSRTFWQKLKALFRTK